MANLLDQADDSELLPPDVQTVHNWNQRYFQLMGDVPQEERSRLMRSLQHWTKESIRWGKLLTWKWEFGYTFRKKGIEEPKVEVLLPGGRRQLRGKRISSPLRTTCSGKPVGWFFE